MHNVKEKKDSKEEWLSQKESEIEGEDIHLEFTASEMGVHPDDKSMVLVHKRNLTKAEYG